MRTLLYKYTHYVLSTSHLKLAPSWTNKLIIYFFTVHNCLLSTYNTRIFCPLQVFGTILKELFFLDIYGWTHIFGYTALLTLLTYLGHHHTFSILLRFRKHRKLEESESGSGKLYKYGFSILEKRSKRIWQLQGQEFISLTVISS